ncbi:DUF4233 domain-containing protein [Gordonia sp. HY002]|uniref:DUF4233 domain-containing protein n=1 Tax=Gordonia zhenghanii TaxID=2911516 RepID=UPI001EF0AE11|nr:DUF4233 domain-containing protein [Gordonia zhenghanii]MCF8569493.1 DUF4233 domain-containing protein [Gordonia zhenghanii]MCF8602336.1 DUF4233 domain-containing protein [Gordonia zhenghanii]
MTSNLPPGINPPATDPWKGFRGVMAGTLILEVIIVLLAFPIVAKIGGGLSWGSGLLLGALTVAFIALSGMCSRSWALPTILALQLVLIVGGLFHWSLAVIGVIFLCVWVYIAYIRRDVARRIEHGLLPSQRLN